MDRSRKEMLVFCNSKKKYSRNFYDECGVPLWVQIFQANFPRPRQKLHSQRWPSFPLPLLYIFSFLSIQVFNEPLTHRNITLRARLSPKNSSKSVLFIWVTVIRRKLYRKMSLKYSSAILERSILGICSPKIRV